MHHIDEGPYVSRIPMQPSCPLVQQPCGLAAAQAPACDRQLFAAATRTEISLPRLIGVRWRRERISHWAAEEGTQMTRDRFSFQSSETLRKRKVWGSFPTDRTSHVPPFRFNSRLTEPKALTATRVLEGLPEEPQKHPSYK